MAVKFVLVCTIGGHLTQLYELSRRFANDDDDIVWVTHDSAQSRSLLADENVTFVPYIDERDVGGVLRTLPSAWKLLSAHQPDIVVSTGSAIALSFLPMAKARGIDAVFIDSAAMVRGRTRTARLLQALPGISRYTQSAATAGGPWRYLGSVFDGFEPVGEATTARPKSMVVMVGTSREFGFRSLIERLVSIIPPGMEVLWQTGPTDVADLPIEATPWVPSSELESRIRDADIVVSHAGCGSALSAIANGKRPILVARRADRGEFNDDHQFEIASLLEERGLAATATTDGVDWPDLVAASRWRIDRRSQDERIDLLAVS